jgi:hypothetical protein
MNRFSTRVFCRCLFLFLVFSIPFKLPAQSFDFGKLDNAEKQESVTDLLEEKEVLWKGNVDVRQFETGFLNDRLVVFYTTGNSLHLRKGNSLDFADPDRSEDLPGKVLYLDYADLPSRKGQSLVTVTFMSQNQFKTQLYLFKYTDDEMSLQKIAERPWELVRVVNQQLLGQNYDPSRIWEPTIHTLTIQEESYAEGETYQLPSEARLMSLRSLEADTHVFIDGGGNLNLTNGGRILNQQKGQYGATPELLKPMNENWRRTDKMEPVRLPPEVGPSGDRLAVTVNPPKPSGLQGLFFGGNASSSVEIIRLENQSFISESSVGPFNNPVLDLEIPPANPDQLLWIRRTEANNLVLEMIELTEN